jgi:hypothetical protein
MLFHYTNTPRTPASSVIDGNTPMTPQTLHECATQQFYQLADNRFYGIAINRAFESCLSGSDGRWDVRLAIGAICILRKYLWRDFTRNSENEWSDPFEPYLSPITRNALPILGTLPSVWKDQDGLEEVISMLASLVEEVVRHWTYNRTSSLASFVGSCVTGFTEILKQKL